MYQAIVSRIRTYPHPDADRIQLGECRGYQVVVGLDTEEINSDNEIFDFITDHYTRLMTSKFMKIMWVSYDSRLGMSADCAYYNNDGELIDIEAILNAR